MQGYLEKQSKVKREWQKRWFVLFSTMLFYIKNGAVRGILSFEQAEDIEVVRLGDMESGDFRFEVSNAVHCFKLKANSKQALCDWLQALPSHDKLGCRWPFSTPLESAFLMQAAHEKTLLSIFRQQRLQVDERDIFFAENSCCAVKGRRDNEDLPSADKSKNTVEDEGRDKLGPVSKNVTGADGSDGGGVGKQNTNAGVHPADQPWPQRAARSKQAMPVVVVVSRTGPSMPVVVPNQKDVLAVSTNGAGPDDRSLHKHVSAPAVVGERKSDANDHLHLQHKDEGGGILCSQGGGRGRGRVEARMNRAASTPPLGIVFSIPAPPVPATTVKSSEEGVAGEDSSGTFSAAPKFNLTATAPENVAAAIRRKQGGKSRISVLGQRWEEHFKSFQSDPPRIPDLRYDPYIRKLMGSASSDYGEGSGFTMSKPNDIVSPSELGFPKNASPRLSPRLSPRFTEDQLMENDMSMSFSGNMSFSFLPYNLVSTNLSFNLDDQAISHRRSLGSQPLSSHKRRSSVPSFLQQMIGVGFVRPKQTSCNDIRAERGCLGGMQHPPSDTMPFRNVPGDSSSTDIRSSLSDLKNNGSVASRLERCQSSAMEEIRHELWPVASGALWHKQKQQQRQVTFHQRATAPGCLLRWNATNEFGSDTTPVEIAPQDTFTANQDQVENHNTVESLERPQLLRANTYQDAASPAKAKLKSKIILRSPNILRPVLSCPSLADLAQNEDEVAGGRSPSGTPTRPVIKKKAAKASSPSTKDIDAIKTIPQNRLSVLKSRHNLSHGSWYYTTLRSAVELSDWLALGGCGDVFAAARHSFELIRMDVLRSHCSKEEAVVLRRLLRAAILHCCSEYADQKTNVSSSRKRALITSGSGIDGDIPSNNDEDRSLSDSMLMSDGIFLSFYLSNRYISFFLTGISFFLSFLP
jgi:hypothetical protein